MLSSACLPACPTKLPRGAVGSCRARRRAQGGLPRSEVLRPEILSFRLEKNGYARIFDGPVHKPKNYKSTMNELVIKIDPALYPAALAAWGLLLAACAYLAFSAVPERTASWEKLPRGRISGTVLMLIGIAWCAYQAVPVLDGMLPKEKIMLIALVCMVAGFFLLDNLFARAIGGIMILTAHFMLDRSFDFHSPIKPLFSAACLVFGTAGIVICAKPYWLRDLVRKICQAPKWRMGAAAAAAAFSLVFLLELILHFTSEK